MAETGLKIENRDGVYFLEGELNEYADFSVLQNAKDPLTLNMKSLTRLNSIGIRNLLRFLNFWGDRPISYVECTAELIDQVNMIPALLGLQRQGKVISLFVPFECDDCGHEEEVFGQVDDFDDEPERPCPKCGKQMYVISDSFFIFRNRSD